VSDPNLTMRDVSLHDNDMVTVLVIWWGPEPQKEERLRYQRFVAELRRLLKEGKKR
jgi:hypothetical protein